jgi:hypothetical protein
LGDRPVVLSLAPLIAAIRIHPPGVWVIEIELATPLQLLALIRIEHRHHCLYATVEVARHPIGATQE